MEAATDSACGGGTKGDTVGLRRSRVPRRRRAHAQPGFLEHRNLIFDKGRFGGYGGNGGEWEEVREVARFSSLRFVAGGEASKQLWGRIRNC